MTEKTGIKSGCRTAQNDGTPSANKQKLSKIVHSKTISKGVFSTKYAFSKRCSKRNVKFLQKVLYFCEICAII